MQGDITIPGNVSVHAHFFPKSGTALEQHVHPYDHISYVASGMVHISAGGVSLGIHVGPSGVLIKGGVQHSFVTMTDDTLILCIHNIADAEAEQTLEDACSACRGCVKKAA